MVPKKKLTTKSHEANNSFFDEQIAWLRKYSLPFLVAGVVAGGWLQSVATISSDVDSLSQHINNLLGRDSSGLSNPDVRGAVDLQIRSILEREKAFYREARKRNLDRFAEINKLKKIEVE